MQTTMGRKGSVLPNQIENQKERLPFLSDSPYALGN